MHQVAVARPGDQRFCGRRFAAGVERRPGLAHGLGFQNRILDPIVLARETEAPLGPEAIDDGEPLCRAGIARVVRIELHPVLLRLLGPPRRDDVERQAPARDVIDVRGLLGEQGRRMKRRAHRHHQLEPLGHRRQRGRRRPGVQRRRIRSLDVVEVELGDEREIESRPFTRTRELPHIRPLGLHPLVLNVAQPPAENRQPISEAHQRASFSMKSTSHSTGSNPTTRGASATKLESALMS